MIANIKLALYAGDVELTDKEIHDRDMDWLSQSDGKCAKTTVLSSSPA